MKFQAETELVRTLKFALSSIYRDKIRIFEEVAVGFGIADLVISSYEENDNESEEKEDLNSKMNLHDINIYCLVYSRPGLRFDEIKETTRVSKKGLYDAIEKLTQLRYIRQEDDCYFSSRSYKFSTKMNFAIEAKLKDWKRALEQAHRYKWFADYSFVVLDEHYSKPAISNIDLFKKYNIGLATISSNGHLCRHFHPTPSKPVDKRMQILFSEKVKTEL